MKKNSWDLDKLQEQLDCSDETRQWRSLDEIAQTEEFARFAESEFPTAWAAKTEGDSSGAGRRDFLKVMGASMGMAGLSACVKQPEEKILPYVKAPENVVPGRPRFFASALEKAGYGMGVVVESHMGRPTHVEGNTEHPSSLGAVDVQTQASVLNMWDPDRSKAVRQRGRPSTWGRFAEKFTPRMKALQEKKGAGLRILTGAVGSPSLGAALKALLKDMPEAKWHQWEAINRDNVLAGTRLAFGEDLEVQYHFEKADVVLLLGADPAGTGPASPAHGRALFSRRNSGEAAKFNRIYAAEAFPSMTASLADHRIPMRAQDLGAFLQDIAKALGVAGVVGGGAPVDAKWAKEIAQDLAANRGKAVVVVGDHLPAEVHALAHAVNDNLKAHGSSVVFTDPVLAKAELMAKSLAELTKDMAAGKVDTLVMLDVNPVYDAPGALKFVEALKKVAFVAHSGQIFNETAQHAHWHLASSHAFEAWADTRAHDGTVTIAQPLIAPLYDTKSPLEIVSILGGAEGKTSHALVQEFWKARRGGADFGVWWRKSLHDGVVAGSAYPTRAATLRAGAASAKIAAAKEGLELVLRADDSVYDGRFANNAWLQEAPRPMTKVTWDNCIYVGPKTAKKLNVKNEQVAKLSVGGTTVQGAVWIVPGIAADSVTVHLGYGHQSFGEVAKGAGFDAYPVQPASGALVIGGASLESTRKTYKIACTQDHSYMEGRAHVRTNTLAGFAKNPGFVNEPDKFVKKLNMYPEIKYEGRAWGMTINLSSCMGCNACVVACQSENNIAVVGKNEVGMGRELHWIRMDRYFEGDIDNPTVYHQPVNCMHCERAPCEPVCPANATVHGPEGLNQMVYNRCIGTRYCSNNCPYKVRRFNFRLYADFDTESLKAQRNPDVTVRSRGVMEKCTYCVQRISIARIQAKLEDRAIADGEVKTACQSACSTGAIEFGDINDPKSRVAAAKKSKLNYALLKELNTAPRTTYLARLSNPNPKVSEG